MASLKGAAAMALLFASALPGQRAVLHPADEADMPSQVDSNSPAYRKDGEMYLFNSTGNGPVRTLGPDQFHLSTPQSSRIRLINQWPTWIEAVYSDPSGPLLAWYHQEHWGLCPGSRLAVPQIGLAVSYDGGLSFTDYGAILTSGDPYDCSAQNGYIAGGYGDFSVIRDRTNEYFYVLFTNYAGPVATQGICAARFPYGRRLTPNSAVMKYYNGGWTEPGIGGKVTPILPARVSWQKANTDSFWGPALHWNTYLKSYVMLLNRSCCTTGFPQKGIYISYSADLSDPTTWTKPVKLLDDPGWYPQVLGLENDGTDRLAGRRARFYIYGHSHLEIEFKAPGS